MSGTSSDLKLIRHNAGNIDVPDDPTFPFKLEVNLRPPEFLSFAFVALYGGSEEIVVRGMTKKTLDAFLDQHHLRTHPRLRRITFTGPDGVISS